jgi:hypothetical protein
MFEFQLPFLMGNTKLERIARKIAPWRDGKTGCHLFLTDGAEQTHPLLLSMVKDSNDCYFMYVCCLSCVHLPFNIGRVCIL